MGGPLPPARHIVRQVDTSARADRAAHRPRAPSHASLDDSSTWKTAAAFSSPTVGDGRRSSSDVEAGRRSSSPTWGPLPFRFLTWETATVGPLPTARRRLRPTETFAAWIARASSAPPSHASFDDSSTWETAVVRAPHVRNLATAPARSSGPATALAPGAAHRRLRRAASPRAPSRARALRRARARHWPAPAVAASRSFSAAVCAARAASRSFSAASRAERAASRSFSAATCDARAASRSRSAASCEARRGVAILLGRRLRGARGVAILLGERLDGRRAVSRSLIASSFACIACWNCFERLVGVALGLRRPRPRRRGASPRRRGACASASSLSCLASLPSRSACSARAFAAAASRVASSATRSFSLASACAAAAIARSSASSFAWRCSCAHTSAPPIAERDEREQRDRRRAVAARPPREPAGDRVAMREHEVAGQVLLERADQLVGGEPLRRGRASSRAR